MFTIILLVKQGLSELNKEEFRANSLIEAIEKYNLIKFLVGDEAQIKIVGPPWQRLRQPIEKKMKKHVIIDGDTPACLDIPLDRVGLSKFSRVVCQANSYNSAIVE